MLVSSKDCIVAHKMLRFSLMCRCDGCASFWWPGVWIFCDRVVVLQSIMDYELYSIFGLRFLKMVGMDQE